MTKSASTLDLIITEAAKLQEERFVSHAGKLMLKLEIKNVMDGQNELIAYRRKLEAAVADIADASRWELASSGDGRMHRFGAECDYSKVQGCAKIAAFNQAVDRLRAAIHRANTEIADHRATLRRYVAQETHR